MLAAHRHGGRVTLLAFARSWDAFARTRRVRRASARELRTLEELLLASLADVSDFARAIAEHQAAVAGRREESHPGAAAPGTPWVSEIRARRLSVPRRSGPRAAAGAAARTA
jgi:hypothetical protein